MLAAATTRLDEHCSADLHWMRVKTRITSDLVIDVFDCSAVILQTRLVFLESFAISFEDSRKKREREDFKSLYTLFFKKRILLTWERYINIERLDPLHFWFLQTDICITNLGKEKMETRDTKIDRSSILFSTKSAPIVPNWMIFKGSAKEPASTRVDPFLPRM